MVKNAVGDVRPGQCVTTFGPGAVIDSLEDSLMILDINHWDGTEDRIYDKQLSNFLGKDYFVKIPTTGGRDIPTVPFPYYHVCNNSSCRCLFDIRDNFNMKEYLNKGPVCPKCEKKSYPARFLVSCENNHLNDFPWHWWAHKKNSDYKDCKGTLTLTSGGESSGLESLSVKCSCLKSGASLSGAMTDSSFESKNENDIYICTGYHPHRLKSEKCNKKLVPLQRGASNVYFPAIRSAITMREEDNLKNLFINKQEKIREFQDLDALEKAFTEKNYLDEFKYNGLNTLDDFMRAWSAFSDTEELSYNQIKELEYKRFTDFEGHRSIPLENPDFEAETQNVPTELSTYFKNITLVHRLKEIMVLLGFTRIESPEPEIKTPEIQWLGSMENKNDNKWLPVVEVYGEGIFLELNRDSINKWLNKVLTISEKYKKIHEKWIIDQGWSLKDEEHKDGQLAKNGLYVMLHTLSHLLIKQLSLTSGYSSVAIKERIYCDDNMAGILLYTGSLDQDGSLGGLVEMGKIEKFYPTLQKALEEALFCTNDPVCSSMNMNEEGDLNGCACFACSMIAETSCENGNRLLDRSLLIPLVNQEEKSFFKENI